MLGCPREQTGQLLALGKSRYRISISGCNRAFVKKRLVQLSRNAEKARRLAGDVAKTVHNIRSSYNCFSCLAGNPFLLTILYRTELNFSIKDIEDFGIGMVMEG